MTEAAGEVVRDPVIFLSYASADRASAESVAAALRSEGIQVWKDSDIAPGAPIGSAIVSHIAEADCVVALVSPTSAASSGVASEVAMAIASSSRADMKKIIPLIISGGFTQLPPLLSRFSAIDVDSAGGLQNATRLLSEEIRHPRQSSNDTNLEFAYLDAQQTALDTRYREYNHESAKLSNITTRWAVAALALSTVALAVASVILLTSDASSLSATILLTTANVAGPLFALISSRRTRTSVLKWAAKR